MTSCSWPEWLPHDYDSISGRRGSSVIFAIGAFCIVKVQIRKTDMILICRRENIIRIVCSDKGAMCAVFSNCESETACDELNLSANQDAVSFTLVWTAPLHLLHPRRSCPVFIKMNIRIIFAKRLLLTAVTSMVFQICLMWVFRFSYGTGVVRKKEETEFRLAKLKLSQITRSPVWCNTALHAYCSHKRLILSFSYSPSSHLFCFFFVLHVLRWCCWSNTVLFLYLLNL